MVTVGHIEAEVLLRFEGSEETYSAGLLEIPLSLTTDGTRGGHLTVRADTSAASRILSGAMEDFAAHLAAHQDGATAHSANTSINNKEN